MKARALIIVGASSHVMQGYRPLRAYDGIFVGSRRLRDKETQATGHDSHMWFQYDLEKDDPRTLEVFDDLERYECIDLIFASYVAMGLALGESITEVQRGLTGNCIQPLTFASELCLRFPNKEIGGVFLSTIYAHVSPKACNYIDGPEINPVFYGVAKAGVEQGLRWLSCQNKKHYFNSIALGPVPKESIQNEYPEFIERLVSSIPSGALIKRETLHKAINYLLDQDGDIRGQTVFVDGGYTGW